MGKRPQYPSDELDKFILRMPAGLRRKLRETAEHNRRSMNAEAIFQLERAIGETTSTQKGEVTA